MTRLLFFATCVLLFVGVTNSQTNSSTPTKQTTIRWNSYDGNCCTNFLRDGNIVTTYGDKRLAFVTTLYMDVDKSYWGFIFSIENSSDEPITILPENFSVRMTAPVNQTYQQAPYQEVAKSMQKRGRWAQFFDAWEAAAASTVSTGHITDNEGYSANVQLTTPDVARRERANERMDKRQAERDAKSEFVNKWAIKGNTLFKDQSLTGIVIFKKKKWAPGFIFSLTIGDTTYEVPFGDERKKLTPPVVK